MTITVEWHDGDRKATQPPNPDYPDGIDMDISRGAKWTCTVALGYPAPGCGVYLISCDLCGNKIAVTTAGRPDDPRSITFGCKQKRLWNMPAEHAPASSPRRKHDA